MRIILTFVGFSAVIRLLFITFAFTRKTILSIYSAEVS